MSESLQLFEQAWEQVVTLPENKHYRFTDLVLCKGIRWLKDRKEILSNSRFQGTILQQYLSELGDALEEQPPRLDILKEIILHHAKTRGYRRPSVNSITLPLRLGDTCDIFHRQKRNLYLVTQIHQALKWNRRQHGDSIVYIVTAMHFGANEMNGKFFFTESAVENSKQLFLYTCQKIVDAGFRFKVISSEDIDHDICFIARSPHILPSESSMTELIATTMRSGMKPIPMLPPPSSSWRARTSSRLSSLKARLFS